MGALATIDDYYAFKGVATPDLDEAAVLKMNADLFRASDRVRGAIRLANYRRADDGLPYVPDQREALTRAVAAEYDAVAAAGGDYTGAEPVFDDVAAIGVQFRRATGSARAWTALEALSPEAANILLAAGFYSTAVRH